MKKSMSYDKGRLTEELNKIKAEIIKQLEIANGNIQNCNLNNLFKMAEDLDHATFHSNIHAETKSSLLNLSHQLRNKSMSIELLRDLLQTVEKVITVLNN